MPEDGDLASIRRKESIIGFHQGGEIFSLDSSKPLVLEVQER
jgi:hypothetical protein